MSIEQIVDVPPGGELTIQLPSPLKNSKQVKVVIEEVPETLDAKIALLNKASQDEDFLADLQAVNEDFENSDSQINE
ncbi:hypothetical protein HRG84_04495 [Flavisolibacter sp. BT320]|nr:hypothetical protein [Flavisolibacter longurius]